MRLVTTTRGGKSQLYLLRGDSEGYVTLWEVPSFTLDTILRLQSEQKPPNVVSSKICTSVNDTWNEMSPPPVGILDQLNSTVEPIIKLTASIYLPQQSRLVVGREDGTIIIVPATQTVMLQLLHGNHQQYHGM